MLFRLTSGNRMFSIWTANNRGFQIVLVVSLKREGMSLQRDQPRAPEKPCTALPVCQKVIAKKRKSSAANFLQVLLMLQCSASKLMTTLMVAWCWPHTQPPRSRLDGAAQGLRCRCCFRPVCMCVPADVARPATRAHLENGAHQAHARVCPYLLSGNIQILPRRIHRNFEQHAGSAR